MNGKLFLVLFFLITFSANVISYSQETVIEVSESGYCSAEIGIEIEEETDVEVVGEKEVFVFELPVENVRELKVSDEFGELEFALVGKELRVELGEGNVLRIEFYSSDFTRKEGEEWSFLIQSNAVADAESLRVKMPQNAKVTFFSENAELYFENSEMIIQWEGMQGNVEIRYSIESWEEEEVENPVLANLLMLVLGGVLILVLGLFVWKNYKDLKKAVEEKQEEINAEEKSEKKKVDEISDEKKDLLKTLSEKEKKILGVLGKHVEGINQKKLTALTSLPKSTLSRTLRKLEKSGFVKIAQEGYTKKISLTEWFLKK